MQVAEVFQSIDGEINPWGQGRLSTFVRLSGCNLACRWCDTPQSKTPGTVMSFDEVFGSIQKLGCHKVTITGGEPLVQMDEVLVLIEILLKWGYEISVETNGSIAPPLIYLQDKRLSWVFDYKLEFPEKMQIKMMENILSFHHWIKIVVGSKDDYRAAVIIKDSLQRMGSKASFAFSPAFDGLRFMLSPNDLVSWLIRDWQWDVVVNIQIHKLICVR